MKRPVLCFYPKKEIRMATKGPLRLEILPHNIEWTTLKTRILISALSDLNFILVITAV